MSKKIPELDSLELYVVRNNEGKFFRAKGYHGTGSTWVENIAKARIYSNLASARTIVSFFANNYPQFDYPVIVEMKVIENEVLDEVDRIKKQKEKKQKEEETRIIRKKKWELECAKAAFNAAQEYYEKLQKSKKK